MENIAQKLRKAYDLIATANTNDIDAYMLMDKDIDEDAYIKCMSDFAFAREMFPFLSREEQKLARGEWYN